MSSSRACGRVFGVALAAVGLALGLAACGGSGRHTSASVGKYGPASSPIAESRCMRANGLPNFPDPTNGPGGEGLPTSSSSPGTLTVEGTAFSGPAFAHAEKACKEYLPPASGSRPALTAAQVRKELALARCMRSHGVPNFPDPTSPGGAKALSPQDLNSPAFQKAARTCSGSHGPLNFTS